MITFNEQELKIFKMIKIHALSFNPPIVPRLAGGFIKDKIMGIESHDIDVVLDRVSGYDFSSGLSKILPESSSVHKIQANPNKSKHLETAVLNFYGISVDFAHLRKEEYAESRVPTITPGTPEEDAFRRDITINSLFYNLLTNEIEDYTHIGMKDIENKIIRTPIDPKITLLEDPLRILRIFRFKSKFNFCISNDIYNSLASEQLKNALKTKVSNERIGIEIFKILEYDHGEIGLFEIIQNKYMDPILKPEIVKNYDFDTAQLFNERIKDIIAELSQRIKCHINFQVKDDLEDIRKETFESKSIEEENQHIIRIKNWILRIYILLQFYSGNKVLKGKKKEFQNVLILKDSLKSSKHIFNKIKQIEENIEFIQESFKTSLTELILFCGNMWLESLIILYAMKNDSKYSNIIFEIIEKGLQYSFLIKPLITGDDLLEMGIETQQFKILLRECWVLQVEKNITDKKILIDLIFNKS